MTLKLIFAQFLLLVPFVCTCCWVVVGSKGDASAGPIRIGPSGDKGFPGNEGSPGIQGNPGQSGRSNIHSFI